MCNVSSRSQKLFCGHNSSMSFGCYPIPITSRLLSLGSLQDLRTKDIRSGWGGLTWTLAPSCRARFAPSPAPHQGHQALSLPLHRSRGELLVTCPTRVPSCIVFGLMNHFPAISVSLANTKEECGQHSLVLTLTQQFPLFTSSADGTERVFTLHGT